MTSKSELTATQNRLQNWYVEIRPLKDLALKVDNLDLVRRVEHVLKTITNQLDEIENQLLQRNIKQRLGNLEAIELQLGIIDELPKG